GNCQVLPSQIEVLSVASINFLFNVIVFFLYVKYKSGEKHQKIEELHLAFNSIVFVFFVFGAQFYGLGECMIDSTKENLEKFRGAKILEIIQIVLSALLVLSSALLWRNLIMQIPRQWLTSRREKYKKMKSQSEI
ncbi:MAG: hypothetical protein MHMPM18_004166, partial [Marteilia pararefringens]